MIPSEVLHTGRIILPRRSSVNVRGLSPKQQGKERLIISGPPGPRTLTQDVDEEVPEVVTVSNAEDGVDDWEDEHDHGQASNLGAKGS